MNNEEIENSLKTEIENYLNTVLADMKQEVSQFQEKLSAEIERHKSELENAFAPMIALSSDKHSLDAGFVGSVSEHLRLAKDEGAKITAIAMDAAEQMSKDDAAQSSTDDFATLKNAIKDVSGKTSQSEILKTLVHHAGDFAARGAFFIIKNDHFVGWRTFGKDKPSNEEVVKEVFLPTSSASILGACVKSLETEKGFADSYPEDSTFLEKLGFGETQQKYAFPLVVRGRSVAVLYADKTAQSSSVGSDALESLVRVAGLTVEILASSRTNPAAAVEAAKPAFVAEKIVEKVPEKVEEMHEPVAPVEPAKTFEYQYQPEAKYEEFQAAPKFEIEPQPKQTFEISPPPQTFDFQPTSSFAQPQVEVESFAPTSSYDFGKVESEPVHHEPIAETYKAPVVETFEPTQWNPPVTNDYSIVKTESVETQPEIVPTQEAANEYSFETDFRAGAYEAPKVEISKTTFDTAGGFSFQDSYATKPEIEQTQSGDLSFPNSAVFNQATSTHVETAPVSTGAIVTKKTRLSDRNVDLPIEVGEDERRLHNDARRFARLLVSEIKLYNEQKVVEGRASNDVYDRLREAIDRSREMYDKRVQPNVAAKFDYFHFELVNTLAEGDDHKMGASYPGASV